MSQTRQEGLCPLVLLTGHVWVGGQAVVYSGVFCEGGGFDVGGGHACEVGEDFLPVGVVKAVVVAEIGIASGEAGVVLDGLGEERERGLVGRLLLSGHSGGFGDGLTKLCSSKSFRSKAPPNGLGEESRPAPPMARVKSAPMFNPSARPCSKWGMVMLRPSW